MALHQRNLKRVELQEGQFESSTSSPNPETEKLNRVQGRAVAFSKSRPNSENRAANLTDEMSLVQARLNSRRGNV